MDQRTNGPADERTDGQGRLLRTPRVNPGSKMTLNFKRASFDVKIRLDLLQQRELSDIELANLSCIPGVC